MTSIKKFFAVTFGVLGAFILAPFVAFFGLMMLGLSFGLALIGAAVVTQTAHEVRKAETAETVDAEPLRGDDVAAETQPA